MKKLLTLETSNLKVVVIKKEIRKDKLQRVDCWEWNANKTNQNNNNKKTDRRTQLKKRDYIVPPYSWIFLINNQIKSNGRLCDVKKNLEQGSIIKEINFNRVKVNVPLVNSIKMNNKLLDDYTDSVYKKIITIAIVVKIMIMIILITIIIDPNH